MRQLLLTVFWVAVLSSFGLQASAATNTFGCVFAKASTLAAAIKVWQEDDGTGRIALAMDYKFKRDDVDFSIKIPSSTYEAKVVLDGSFSTLEALDVTKYASGDWLDLRKDKVVFSISHPRYVPKNSYFSSTLSLDGVKGDGDEVMINIEILDCTGV